MTERDPLDLHLNDAEAALLVDSRSLAEATLRPVADSGGPGELNRPLVKAIAAGGLFGRLFNRGDDGTWTTSVSALDLCLIREGLAQASTEAETAFAVQGLGSFPMLQSGRPEVVGPWIDAAREPTVAFVLSAALVILAVASVGVFTPAALFAAFLAWFGIAQIAMGVHDTVKSATTGAG